MPIDHPRSASSDGAGRYFQPSSAERSMVMNLRCLMLWVTAVVCLLVVVESASAQGRRGRHFGRGHGFQSASELGVRGGYDYDEKALSAGVVARLALVRRLPVQLVPSADLFILQEDVDWQANVDVALRSRGPLYFGGGLAVSNRILDSEGERKVDTGNNWLVGMRLPMRNVRFRVRVEGRWTYIVDEESFRLTVAITWPLGGRSSGRR